MIETDDRSELLRQFLHAQVRMGPSAQKWRVAQKRQSSRPYKALSRRDQSSFAYLQLDEIYLAGNFLAVGKP